MDIRFLASGEALVDGQLVSGVHARELQRRQKQAEENLDQWGEFLASHNLPKIEALGHQTSILCGHQCPPCRIRRAMKAGSSARNVKDKVGLGHLSAQEAAELSARPCVIVAASNT